MPKIFITGSTGFLGRYICQEFSQRGYEVFALTRKNSNKTALLNNKVNIIEGDLDNEKTIYSCLRDNNIEQVIHAAAIVSDWGPRHIFHSINVRGTEKLLDACKRAKIKLFIYISTIDVMDYRRHHQVLAESFPYTKSKHNYQWSKTIAEVKSLLASDYFKVVVLRPAWIFGEGDKTLFPEIIHTLKQGLLPLPGKRGVYIPLIYVRNLAKFIGDIVSQIESLPSSIKINVSDDVKITWKQLIEILRKNFNPRALVINVPYSLSYIVAVILELLYRLLNIKTRPTLTTGSLPMLASSMEIDTTLMKKFLKSPLIPFESAISSTLAWHKVNLVSRKKGE
ncbi:MAG: hypothetical protein A2744_01590 [Candidatus Buchananbacteria bacterium RIFCSPHIGHO2_01_FULL_44_11]|uniref:NAD-dependent epimerase/dehydratase domain-containing protein n=1 Tax=Candidatus Buchananbacteria bacterium RIFCSPHIGHO2_01_FULL_44_11 TaxID=1797535 RepID=A0A1G1Y2L5_9BACT|nr:MAG: hypothetical protein A2744_01590 [Candidatus Buchananbacteria bacterium RIFCSPHIGHO2_01_FULL_44_11]